MEYSGLAASWDRVVVRGDLCSQFIAFWLKDQRVVAGMNANVWDVTESIQALIRERPAGRPGAAGRPRHPPGPGDRRAGDNEHPMTKLRQLHDRYGQSPG